MSRSKRDILDTERMLERLTKLLLAQGSMGGLSVAMADAEALRRISMTLHHWHELECGTDRGAIERRENDTPFLRWKTYSGNVRYSRLPDRETGARKRLKKIMARYPALQAYVQTDPRGCALYILKPGGVPNGVDVSAYYNRGLAVHR